MTSLRRSRSEEIDTFDPQARVFAQDGTEYENFAAYLKGEPAKTTYNDALHYLRFKAIPEEGISLFIELYKHSPDAPYEAYETARLGLTGWIERQNESLFWDSR